jgi:hypothetical protein
VLNLLVKLPKEIGEGQLGDFCCRKLGKGQYLRTLFEDDFVVLRRQSSRVANHSVDVVSQHGRRRSVAAMLLLATHDGHKKPNISKTLKGMWVRAGINPIPKDGDVFLILMFHRFAVVHGQQSIGTNAFQIFRIRVVVASEVCGTRMINTVLAEKTSQTDSKLKGRSNK